MVIDLNPELEAKVAENAAALGYESPEAYVADRLTAWHEMETFLREERESVSAMIDEGWEDVAKDVEIMRIIHGARHRVLRHGIECSFGVMASSRAVASSARAAAA